MATLMSPTEPTRPRRRTTPADGGTDAGHGWHATRRTVAAIGAVTALAGIEHGVGEILQGNVAPGGVTIASWPGSDAFRILGGEPALTVVPNLLATGVLAILSSLLFLVWATTFVRRKHGGLVLILLSLVMLLVGAGFGPPLVGIVLGVAATRIGAPLGWWRTQLSGGSRRFLAALWPWSFGADLIAWLSLLPGVVLAGSVVGGDHVPAGLVYGLVIAAYGFLLLTVVAGFAHDVQGHPDGRPAL